MLGYLVCLRYEATLHVLINSDEGLETNFQGLGLGHLLAVSVLVS